MGTTQTEKERLLSLHARHVTALDDGDLDELAEVFDPNCLIFDGPSPVVRGWPAYRDRLEHRLRDFTTFGVRSFDEITRGDERRDERIARIAARYEVKGEKNGQPYLESGRWTGIYEKRNDRWQIVHFHVSPDPESP